MALDFPASPSDGDVYGAYYYDASVGAWKTSPAQPTTTSISVTKPSNPNPGDTWFDTTNGTLFIYYEDEDSSQWVEVQASSSLNTALEGRIGVLETEMDTVQTEKWQSYNYVINGAFDVWQRGETFTVSSSALQYTADRWYCVADGTTTVSKITTGKLQGSSSSLRSTRSTATLGSHNINQLIETSNVLLLIGKTVTFSAYLRRSSGIENPISLNIYKSSTVDAGDSSTWSTVGTTSVPISVIPTGTSSSSWYRATLTATIPDDGTVNTLMLSIGTFGINNSDYFEITGVQLEEGSIATPFRRNAPSIQAELAACRRYYLRYYGEVIGAKMGVGYGGNSSTGAMVYYNSFRVPPYAVEFSSLSDFTLRNGDATVNSAVTAITLAGSLQFNREITIVNVTVASIAGLANAPSHLRASTTTAYIGLSAEL
jgi:hypothetical protein